MSVSVLHTGSNGYAESTGPTSSYASTTYTDSDLDAAGPTAAAVGTASQSFFVRALFDFSGQDTSSLSFKRGDVIEVLNTLPSGWWDGLLDDERGWFPSNYVQPITEQEAEAALSFRMGLHQQQQQQQQVDPQLVRQHQHQKQLEQQRLVHQQQQQQRAQLD
jgi:son of sevenless-like protein